MGLKITGKLPSGKIREQVQQSPNYRKNSFQNLSPTPTMAPDTSYRKLLREFFKRNPASKPPSALPFVKTDLSKLVTEEPVVVWFGHSSYLVRMAGKNFLVDPVLSGNASPVSFMIKAFPGTNYYTADKMPFVDYLLLTHDHYDHLDYKTITLLKKKTGRIICSLGLSSHLRYWGISGEMITETDWWDRLDLENGVSLTAAPARHFSGRGIIKAQTLWSSFILSTKDHRLYLGGDSGYDFHFSEIGKRFGPFEMAILESGQYNSMWPLIHMKPEETVQAAIDLGAQVLMPVHWGKFALAMHNWNEPVKRIVAAANDMGLKITTPLIGEPVILNKSYPASAWWNLL